MPADESFVTSEHTGAPWWDSPWHAEAHVGCWHGSADGWTRRGAERAAVRAARRHRKSSVSHRRRDLQTTEEA